MRIFSIDQNGTFEEFARSHFSRDFEEATLETWLENNADDILEDGKLLIIGRQVVTNLGSIIDLLGVDRDGNAVVIELKRDRTPRDTLAQALEYASFVEDLDAEQLTHIHQRYCGDSALSLPELHRTYFDLQDDDAIAFNKDQRIVLVGQKISGEIRQTATFLRKKGLRVTCLEFSYFKAGNGKHLLSYDIVVGRDPAPSARVLSGTQPVTNRDQFLHSLDDNGRPVFETLLGFADEHGLPLHWGTKGFSMNVDKSGTHVSLGCGYPPASVYKQSFYTTLVGQGGLLRKLANAGKAIDALQAEARSLPFFQTAGRELKVTFDRPFTTGEIGAITAWLEKVVHLVRRHPLA